MHDAGFFFQAFVYLTAAVVSVPIAKRLGLGSVLGYLIAGVVIGPFVLGLIGEEGQDIMHFAEFGVVMMLFLVGLELQPALLWRLRGPIVGMGGTQVVLTALVTTGIALGVGQSWQVSLAIGLTLAMSSTAIVIQSLNERGLMHTDGGQRSFSILLFQDIAVIPMLALMPLLATHAVDHIADAHHNTLISGLPGWQQALAVLGLMAAIVVAGRILVRPVLRFIAGTRLRETFTATALLIVIGIALAMQAVGLSAALGTFVAGVVLAESEYRHELESAIEPFKGILLGLFFIAVGASIDFNLVSEDPGLILSLVGALITVKFLALVITARVFRMAWSQNFLLSFTLAQGGEFAFVLFSFATQNGVLDGATAGPLVVAVALSMALTPLLMIVNESLVQPRFATAGTDREPDAIDEENAVIIAGFGRFGHIVGRLLKANGVGTTVLDLDPEQIETLRRFDLKVFYGDAGRPDLLHQAGAEKARLLLLAIDEPEKATAIATEVRRRYPNLRVMARAEGLHHAYELMKVGVDDVFRETLGSALSMGEEALKALGFRAFQAHRAVKLFKKENEAATRELYDMWDSEEDYEERVREQMTELDELMRHDRRTQGEMADHAWRPASRPDA